MHDELLAALPKLRAFAMSLCGAPARADDLVQQTVTKAWANQASFAPGSNMIAWLYTILRNEFYTEYRRRRREVPDSEGYHAGRVAQRPPQEDALRVSELRAALAELPPNQREALILVGASGYSYEEAAAMCDCAVGTLKSRVSRARARLAVLLPLSDAPRSGAEEAWSAAVDVARAAPKAPGGEH